MRILAITNMYPPHHYGGYELVCQEVLDRFRARGHDVVVLTSTIRVPGVPDRAEGEPGVRRELHAYWHDHELLRPPLRERWRIEKHNQRVLTDLLDGFAPDVVSVWHMGALSFGLLETVERAGLPSVYMVCDDWLVYGPKMDPWMKPFVAHGALGRLVERLAGVPAQVPSLDGGFCFVSAHTRGVAARSTSWELDPATVTYSGINTEHFPVAGRDEPPWQWRLLIVGRIDQRKGIDVALDALARLPADASLDVVGRGDETHERELKQHADALGLSARVAWSVAERPELAGRYRAADVVVFPVRWDEPFGLVPLEAMACGTPVVATGTGGSAEFLLHERNCLLVPPGDAGALEAAVRRLAAEPELRARLVVGGLATAAELTVDRLTDVLEQWHLAALDRYRSGVPADRPTIDSVV